LQRLLGHVGSKGVMGVRQVGQREGHGGCPQMVGVLRLTEPPYRRFQRASTHSFWQVRPRECAPDCKLPFDRIMIVKKLLRMKHLKRADMNLRFASTISALAISILAIPASTDAAGLRGRFSVDGIASCDNPPIRNFPVHMEGTAELLTNKSAS